MQDATFNRPALEKPSGPCLCDQRATVCLWAVLGPKGVGGTSTHWRHESVSLSLQSNGQSLHLTQEARRCLPRRGHPSLESGRISSAGWLWAYLSLAQCAGCSCPWPGRWFSGWRRARRPTWLGGASSPGLWQWSSEDRPLCRERSACNPVRNVKHPREVKGRPSTVEDKRFYETSWVVILRPFLGGERFEK